MAFPEFPSIISVPYNQEKRSVTKLTPKLHTGYLQSILDFKYTNLLFFEKW